MKGLWIAAAVAFLLDQASKYYVVHVLQVQIRGPIEVFPPYLRYVYGENYGINFGIGGDAVSAWIWVAIAAVVCAWVLWWVRRVPNMPRLGYVCAGFLIGGALGNVIDRAIFGYVQDFLNNSCCGFTNPFSYNIADIFVFAGAIGLVFFVPDPKKPSKKGT